MSGCVGSEIRLVVWDGVVWSCGGGTGPGSRGRRQMRCWFEPVQVRYQRVLYLHSPTTILLPSSRVSAIL